MFYRFVVSMIAVSVFTFVVSCDDEPAQVQEGKVEFSFDNNTGGRQFAEGKSVLVTVKDGTGAIVYDRKKLSLFQFSGEYLSEPIALKIGNFSVTEYIVLDEDDNAVYATPMEGSPLEHLVDDPLPISFSVTKDKTTKVSPQVIKVEGHTGIDFGYATFSFDEVATFNFLLGVHAYNSTSQNFELTTASLKITSGSDVQVDRSLSAQTHTITVVDNMTNYTVVIEKAGYTTYSRTFAIADLKAFGASPLVVTLMNEGLTTGLVAHYPFSGNASDATGHNLNGTVNGATLTTDRDGIANSAYNFDGNDYISVADNSLLDFASDQDFSISLWAWVSPTQNLEGGINDIIRKWSGDHQGYPFGISFDNEAAPVGFQKTFLAARYDGHSCLNAPVGYTPATTYSTFHHLVLTKQGSSLKFYLDNVLAATYTDNTTEGSYCSTKNDSHMTIGTRGQLARFFTGKIDDIRIYNRTLTASEITILNAE